jgi:hypothetical protein
LSNNTRGNGGQLPLVWWHNQASLNHYQYKYIKLKTLLDEQKLVGGDYLVREINRSQQNLKYLNKFEVEFAFREI